MSWVKDYSKPVSLEPIKFESVEERRKCIAENKRKLKDESAWITAHKSTKRRDGSRREPAGTTRKIIGGSK